MNLACNNPRLAWPSATSHTNSSSTSQRCLDTSFLPTKAVRSAMQDKDTRDIGSQHQQYLSAPYPTAPHRVALSAANSGAYDDWAVLLAARQPEFYRILLSAPAISPVGPGPVTIVPMAVAVPQQQQQHQKHPKQPSWPGMPPPNPPDPSPGSHSHNATSRTPQPLAAPPPPAPATASAGAAAATVSESGKEEAGGENSEEDGVEALSSGTSQAVIDEGRSSATSTQSGRGKSSNSGLAVSLSLRARIEGPRTKASVLLQQQVQRRLALECSRARDEVPSRVVAAAASAGGSGSSGGPQKGNDRTPAAKDLQPPPQPPPADNAATLPQGSDPPLHQGPQPDSIPGSGAPAGVQEREGGQPAATGATQDGTQQPPSRHNADTGRGRQAAEQDASKAVSATAPARPVLPLAGGIGPWAEVETGTRPPSSPHPQPQSTPTGNTKVPQGQLSPPPLLILPDAAVDDGCFTLGASGALISSPRCIKPVMLVVPSTPPHSSQQPHLALAHQALMRERRSPRKVLGGGAAAAAPVHSRATTPSSMSPSPHPPHAGGTDVVSALLQALELDALAAALGPTSSVAATVAAAAAAVRQGMAGACQDMRPESPTKTTWSQAPWGGATRGQAMTPTPTPGARTGRGLHPPFFRRSQPQQPSHHVDHEYDFGLACEPLAAAPNQPALDLARHQLLSQQDEQARGSHARTDGRAEYASSEGGLEGRNLSSVRPPDERPTGPSSAATARSLGAECSQQPAALRQLATLVEQAGYHQHNINAYDHGQEAHPPHPPRAIQSYPSAPSPCGSARRSASGGNLAPHPLSRQTWAQMLEVRMRAREKAAQVLAATAQAALASSAEVLRRNSPGPGSGAATQTASHAGAASSHRSDYSATPHTASGGHCGASMLGAVPVAVVQEAGGARAGLEGGYAPHHKAGGHRGGGGGRRPSGSNVPWPGGSAPTPRAPHSSSGHSPHDSTSHAGPTSLPPLPPFSGPNRHHNHHNHHNHRGSAVTHSQTAM